MTKLDEAGNWTAKEQKAVADELVRQRCENTALLERLRTAQMDAARYRHARTLGCELWYEAWAGSRRRIVRMENLDELCDKAIERAKAQEEPCSKS